MKTAWQMPGTDAPPAVAGAAATEATETEEAAPLAEKVAPVAERVAPAVEKAAPLLADPPSGGSFLGHRHTHRPPLDAGGGERLADVADEPLGPRPRQRALAGPA